MIEFFHVNKDYFKSDDLGFKAKQLSKHLNHTELVNISSVVNSEAFTTICDLMRMENKLQDSEKVYDQFPHDLRELGLALGLLLKKGK